MGKKSKSTEIVKRAAGEVAGADGADERKIDRWVAELRRIVVGGQVELAADVGEFLIEHVYGSVEEARSRHPRKNASLARLAERAAEFGMRPTGVRQAIPIAVQVRELGRPLGLKLTVDQHRALAVLEDAGEKKVLGQAAVDAGWTARELRQKVRLVKRPHRGGRPAQPLLRLFIARMDRQLKEADVGVFRSELSVIGESEARRLLARVNAAQALLERVEKLLTRALVPPK